MTRTEFRKIRKSLGLSVEKFAKRIGRCRTQVFDYEQGRAEIPLIVENSVRYVEIMETQHETVHPK